MEENNQADQQVQDQAPVTSPVTETQETVSDPEVTSTSENTNSKEENINSSTEEKREKPRRAERRVHQLLDKLKDRDGNQSQAQEATTPQKLPWEQVYEEGNEPLIRPGETEIDPIELQRRQQAQLALMEQKISRNIEQRIKYNQVLSEHTQDVERTASLPELTEGTDEYDPVLDSLVAKQYDLENRVYNPMTGTFDFVPNRKMSEIYSEIKNALEAKTAKAQARVSQALHEQAETSAVTPSGQGVSNQDYESEALYEKASESGSAEDWAQVLKKRLFSKR